MNTLELLQGSQLDSGLFNLVWRATKNQVNQHNLVCEMITRRDFVLMESEKLIFPIGKLGARVTLFYLNLEEQFQFKRQNDHSEVSHRVVHLPELSQMLQAVPTRQPTQLQAWRAVLEKLKGIFASKDDFKVKLTYIFQREAMA